MKAKAMVNAAYSCVSNQALLDSYGEIETVRDIHLNDIAEVGGEASLPAGLARKYPYAIKELKWQYLFPSTSRCQHPADGYYCRHHLHWTALTKVLRVAVKKSGIPSYQCLRNTEVDMIYLKRLNPTPECA